MGIFGNFKLKKPTEETYPPGLVAVLPKDRKKWWKTKNLLRLNILLLVPLLSSGAIGFDGAMMNGLQTLPQWRETFGNPEGAILGLMNAVYPVAKIIAIPPAAFLCDKYGRKWSLWAGLMVLPIGAALQTASMNTPMFIVSRAIVGFGTTFLAHTSPIIITELAFPTHRGKVTALYNTCYFVGAVLAAWSTFGTFRINSTWAWRIPSLLQQFLPTFQTILMFWLPESPRWLISNGKHEEARNFLVKYHAEGDESSPLVDFEIEEISHAIEQEKSIETTGGYYELIANAANRRRAALTFGLGWFTQYNGNSVLSYYLVLVLNTIGITGTEEQTLINGMLQIFNWASAVSGGVLLVDRVGRRRLLFVATLGMMLSYIAWTILNSQFALSHDQNTGYGVLAFIFIFSFFYAIAWTPLPIAYTTEIWPFTLRGRGVALYYLSSFSSLLVGQFVNPIAMRDIGWRYYIVFCAILAFLVIAIYMWMPETKGRTLEEIAEIFEGPRARLDVAAGSKIAEEEDKGGPAVTEVEANHGNRDPVR